LLDSAEGALRTMGEENAADAIVKLQQDVGVQIDRQMNGFDENEPAPGPETARLNAAYEPVTDVRLGILQKVCQKLPQGDVKNNMELLVKNLKAMMPKTPHADFGKNGLTP